MKYFVYDFFIIIFTVLLSLLYDNGDDKYYNDNLSLFYIFFPLYSFLKKILYLHLFSLYFFC